jgi:hypothetical protein
VAIVPFPELKAHLNITGTTNDEELMGFLDSAEELVRQEAAVYAPQSYTETVAVDSGVAILSHTPVISLTSVTASGETITGATASRYGLLRGVRGWREVTVTYTAGTAVPPARVHTAVLMVTARLWETQRGNTPTVFQGGEEPTFTPGMQGILGEVRALLGAGGLGVVV